MTARSGRLEDIFVEQLNGGSLAIGRGHVLTYCGGGSADTYLGALRKRPATEALLLHPSGACAPRAWSAVAGRLACALERVFCAMC
jgi:hypothetical protein